MDWLNGFIDDLNYFTADVFNGITEIIDNTNELAASLNEYIKFSTYYIWISGAMLLIMFFMIWVLHTKMDRMADENKKIQNQLTLVIQYVKPEEISEGGNTNGSDDQRSYEGDHGRG